MHNGQMEQIPDWLVPDIPITTKRKRPSAVQVATPTSVTMPLEPITDYGIGFERLLDMMVTTQITVPEFCREYHKDFTHGGFMRWILADKDRAARFREAKAIMAELMEGELIAIADARDNLMEDVTRSKLRIDTRWKWMAVNNPDRYAPKKDNGLTGDTSINITIAGVGEMQTLERETVTYDG